MPEVSDRRVPRRKDTLTHEVTDTDEVVIYDSNGPQLLVRRQTNHRRHHRRNREPCRGGVCDGDS